MTKAKSGLAEFNLDVNILDGPQNKKLGASGSGIGATCTTGARKKVINSNTTESEPFEILRPYVDSSTGGAGARRWVAGPDE